MPGTNAGTGYPIFFKCPKCVRRAGWRNEGNHGFKYEVTGKVRPLTSAQQGHGNPRAVYYRVQFKCLECGHVGWSRHKDLARRLQRQFQVSEPLMEGLRRISREITIGVGEKPSDSGELGLEPRPSRE